MWPDEIEALARQVVEEAIRAGLTIATAESCTGGLVAGALTSIAGSSAVVERSFVTYSNAAKAEMLGVPSDLIERHGAVSKEVATSMARGAVAASPADLAVSITGIAGPGGGSAEKPVGLVHFAVFGSGASRHVERRFGDLGRDAVRLASVAVALELLLEALRDEPLRAQATGSVSRG